MKITSSSETRLLEGGCHCGAVRFKALLRFPADALLCNCSICRMAGYRHINIKHGDVEISDPENCLNHYRFGTETADHPFCSRCGIKPFYQPRSHPDHWSINANCVTSGRIDDLEFVSFDGHDWESNIQKIKPSP